MSATIRWLQARADNVAVALLAAMFIAFILQIFTRYVINDPLGWTLEVCLTTWLWLVFWSSAFVLTERDHVTFDLFYLIASRRMQRVFALISAAAIVAGFLAALPATYEYIAFYKIKKSATLRIRLDVVFSVYGLFAVAVIVRYALRIWQLARGGAPEQHDEATPL
ncbi:TRAP transporter small permease subunit [Mesorhizobium sp. B2-1-8]|uniref:TRAP transporter small permease n=1 Tax=unclassified Mesorhizobium TaxID=325217 RepID=UPI00112A4B36|nr:MULTISPECIES: TRAP transporter small permease subunit [unclassified Mesorhizobium]TPI29830.1 TRAP transporter small permease subunit [Mesorhizobium sp. B3-2-1]UCI21774.1 TRAP transporter small permease subunit [Mesorhizobium sp. B2-1-8]